MALATLVRPFGAIICAEEAHIATDECGAPEFYTGGAKLIALPNTDGRITPAQINAVMARATDGGVHHVLPEAVSITQATEWGTVYSVEEVTAMTPVQMYQGMEGSRRSPRAAKPRTRGGFATVDMLTPRGLPWRI